MAAKQADVEGCILDRKVTRFIAAEMSTCKEFLRRSVRDPSVSMMDRNDLSIILERIRTNHSSSVVLKIKDHLLADISSSVFDAIVEALWKNKVCQGLYIQNLAKAIGDVQLRALVELLKKKMIWCVNIGESYEVTMDGWRYFCASLSKTNVTHLYVSEHTIPIELKNEMRDHIRENRKKHNLHCAFKNLGVIERCTHMWWNPINGVKELKPPPPPKPEEEEDEEEEQAAPVVIALTPAHTAYWQEGVGEGGDKPWKFKCMCGESCSSYENFRYHPTGRMFECSNPACCLWSHVHCVLGPNFTDKELETRKDLLCGACKAKSRRLSKYMGVSITELNAPPHNSKNNSNSSSNSSRPDGDEEDDGKPWTFRCKCGEVCSSYEKAMYHPAGQWYECSQCAVWSHVHCMLGKVTPDQILEMKEVLCFSCTTKARRSRSRGTVVEEVPKSPVAAGVEPAELEPAATVVAMREETCLANRSDYPTNTSAESAVEVPKLVTVEVVAVNSADVTNVEQVIFEPSGFVDPALVDLAVSALSSAVPYNVELVIEPLVVTEETAADVEVASAAENEAEIFKPQILQVVADCRQVPVMREEMGSEVFSISFSTSSNTSDDVAFGNTLDIPCGGSSAPKRKCDFEEEREQKSNHVVQL